VPGVLPPDQDVGLNRALSLRPAVRLRPGTRCDTKIGVRKTVERIRTVWRGGASGRQIDKHCPQITTVGPMEGASGL